MQRTLTQIAVCEDFGPLPAPAATRDMKRVEELLAKGIVEDVKLQGLTSLNRRTYLLEGMDPATYAKTPYGTKMPINLNHPHFDPNNQADVRRAITKSRPVEHVFGSVEEPYKQPDGMYAKRLRFNTAHPFAKTFANWVRNDPTQIGLSPAQFVDSYHDGEKEVVERVAAVYSIDLVGQGATTKGIFEAMGFGENEEPDVEDVETPPADLLDGGLEEDELDDDLDADTDEPDGETDAEGSGVDISPEIEAAGMKILQARLSGELDDKAALKKLKHLFGTHSAVSEAVMGTITKDPAKFLRKHTDKAVRVAGRSLILENVSLKQEKTLRDKRSKVTALVEARSFDPDIVKELGLIDELMECPTEAAMGRKLNVIAKLPGVVKKGGRPKSAAQMPAKAITEGVFDTSVFDEAAADKRLEKMANAVVGAAELS